MWFAMNHKYSLCLSRVEHTCNGSHLGKYNPVSEALLSFIWPPVPSIVHALKLEVMLVTIWVHMKRPCERSAKARQLRLCQEVAVNSVERSGSTESCGHE